MDDIGLAHEYMVACILAQNPRDAEHWDTATVHKVFKTLPRNSFCDFNTWKSRVNVTVETTTPATVPEPANPSPEDMAKTNAMAFTQLASLSPELQEKFGKK